MAKKWSANGQTPEFLAATRMISLNDRIVAAILGHLQLKPGMDVLDVGCGSGEYCFRLGSQLEGVRFTGIDADSAFVDFANCRAREEIGYPFEVPNPRNRYRFICADGLNLPFPDDAFDAVVSHTYLTAVPDWERALDEMRRVCKTGGNVSSVTSLTSDFYGTGAVWLFAGPLDGEDADLVGRVSGAKAVSAAGINLTAGISPRNVPAAFGSRFDHVRCMPIGHYFCLSDATVSPEDYMRHVDLLKAAELAELHIMKADSQTRDLLPDDDWTRFEQLVNDRHEQLVDLAGDNSEWAWYGNASLLASGVKPS